MVGSYKNYTLPNVSDGYDQALTGVFSQVPELSAGILLFVWLFIFLSGTALQKKRTNEADYPQWALVASLPTMLLSLLFTLRSGMIGIEILAGVVGITVLSGMWFFLSKGKNEV